MPSVLLTAFGPYDSWSENASWLCLRELTRELPEQPKVVTRKYPVDFSQVRMQLEQDLRGDYDFALHLGQAPGSGQLRLEAVGLNVGATTDEVAWPLEPAGPAAYQSSLPLADWAARLRGQGIPARVSYHAGTYLCNAALYWSQFLAEQMGLRTQSLFVHVPLDVSQTLALSGDHLCLPAAVSAAGLRIILAELSGASPI